MTKQNCKGNRWELGRGPQHALWGSKENILELNNKETAYGLVDTPGDPKRKG